MKRRWLAPEVVQTSANDCGPAALKCLLEGFGVRASYGRLREACQTEVDGTSIDTIEEVAQRLGLEGEQVMLPVDHILVPDSESIPAMVIVRHPPGITHFVVVWRYAAGIVQLMDPSTGRRWMREREFLERLFIHTVSIPETAWDEWARSDSFLGGLKLRMRRLEIDHTGQELIGTALQAPNGRAMAVLDAALRMVDAMVRSGGVKSGREASTVLELTFNEAAAREPDKAIEIVPEVYWFARPGEAIDGVAHFSITGAVLLTVRGVRAEKSPEEIDETPLPLPAELAAALREPPMRPLRELFTLLREDGALKPAVVLFALATAALGTVTQAVLFRGLLDIGRTLRVQNQRFASMAVLIAFLIALLAIELPISHLVANIGRTLETRLRLKFLMKIPRIGDRYFHSRATSDMAERGHAMHEIRTVPQLGQQLLQTAMELIFTTLGLAWLDPSSAPIAITAGLVGALLPLALQAPIAERDLRVQVHNGSIARFYLDALLGIIAVRTHSAERAVRREHESLMVEWAMAARALARTAVSVEALQALVGFGLAVWLLSRYLGSGGNVGGALLLVYWALDLPNIGQYLAITARQYPRLRNVMLRVLEPLGAQEEIDLVSDAPLDNSLTVSADRGAAVKFERVSVLAGGHTILDDVSFELAPGERVAIVGPSGAGKSSLAGVLLGWHRAAMGRVSVDGEPLKGPRLADLRRQTVWVDPSVQLWNRSLLWNLQYGASEHDIALIPEALERANLRPLVEQLPEGLQTRLGESGTFISGGEGQRVRLGRALMRRRPRLVILDEAFRGLDRELRRSLLVRAESWWSRATFLSITHDLAETLDFTRVLVLEDGKIVEDGPPRVLAERDTRYREMLRAEEKARRALWTERAWRRIRVDAGRVTEEGSAPR
jgi:ATP-binding cassette subfamily B protein